MPRAADPTPHFDSLYDDCKELDCELWIMVWERMPALLIVHRDRGPMVMWTAFQGSIEDVARYARSSLPEVRRQSTDGFG